MNLRSIALIVITTILSLSTLAHAYTDFRVRDRFGYFDDRDDNITPDRFKKAGITFGYYQGKYYGPRSQFHRASQLASEWHYYGPAGTRSSFRPASNYRYGSYSGSFDQFTYRVMGGRAVPNIGFFPYVRHTAVAGGYF